MACHCETCAFMHHGGRHGGRHEYDSDGFYEYGGGYGGYDGYGGYGGEASNGVSYGNFREKSNAAESRELTAKYKFKALADATPANISGGNPLPPLSADAIQASLWKLCTQRNSHVWS